VLLLDEGLEDGDFARAGAEGVSLAKIGFGQYASQDRLRRHVELARDAGMVVMAHSGPAGLAEGESLGGEQLVRLTPDVYAHVNGGPTSLSVDEIRLLVSSSGALQLVAAGNLSAAIRTVNLAVQAQQLHRLILGSETPSGAGVMPTAILRLIALLAAMTDVSPESLWSCASGIAARVFRQQGGALVPGAPADLCLMDAPRHSQHRNVKETFAAGDCPSVQLMMVGGRIAELEHRNTPLGENRLRIVRS
jgi:enamidase